MTSKQPFGPNYLERQVLAAKVRLTQLQTVRQQPSGQSDRVLDEALAELAVALEELHVTSEEINQKTAHLLSMRQGLAQERQRYKTLFDCAPDPYFVTDLAGTIQAANYRAATLLHQRADLLHQKPLVRFMAEGDRPLVYQKLTQIGSRPPEVPVPAAGPPSILQDWPMPAPIVLWQDQDLRLQPRDQQTTIPMRLSLAGELDDQGNLVRLLWLFRDVSQRQQGEIALQTLAQELQSLYDQAPCGYHSLDPEGRLTHINETELNWLGNEEADQLLGTYWRDRLTPASQQRFDPAFAALRQRGQIRDLELELYGYGGQILPISVSSTAIRSATGEFLMGRAVVVDISDRHRQTQQIAQQAALLDLTADGIWVQNLDNCISFWNQGAEQLYGWTAAEALGQDALSFLHPDPESLDQIWPTLIRDGTWTGELNQITQTGQRITVMSRWALVKNDAGRSRSILVANTDITTQKQLEKQFHHAQRLESLGTLAGGIAHDLNNIFTPILAVAQLLTLKFPHLDSEAQRLLAVLENGAQRGAGLVNQILSTTRGSPGNPSQIDLKALLEDTAALAQQTFPKSIAITIVLPDSPLWPLLADDAQLHQVLMNLMVNSRDAMADGGTLTLSAENYPLDWAAAQGHLGAQAGHYLRITVADTGTGIEPAIQEQIFDPFFTTKAMGKGTGLGLTTVQGIVKQQGGFLQVLSQPGAGSTFQIYLPALEVTPSDADPPPTSPLPQGNGELILVVDDDPLIQQTIPIVLATNGYQPLLAQDGVEALDLFETYQTALAAVFMDMMMPNLDGAAAIRAIQEINPQVPIMAVSGLPSNQSAALSAGARTFLPKPYTTTELLNTLGQMLSASAPPVAE